MTAAVVESQAPAPEAAAPATTSWGRLTLLLAAGVYVWTLLWLVLAAVVPWAALGWEPTVVTSGSMAPVIRTGDIVLLRDVDARTLAPGTVVGFDDPARPGTRVLHRIVGVHPDGSYRTKGDANAVADSTPVPPDRIHGAGIVLLPFLGLPLRWLVTAPHLALAWLGATGVAVMLATDPLSASSGRRTGPERGEGTDSRIERRRTWRGRRTTPQVREVDPAGAPR